jgi:hypothetical protein
MTCRVLLQQGKRVDIILESVKKCFWDFRFPIASYNLAKLLARLSSVP